MFIHLLAGNNYNEVIKVEFHVSNKAKEQLEQEFSGKTVRIFPYKKG